MAKEYSFRGKTVEELKGLSLEEFSKLCTSRVRRTITRSLGNEDFKKLAEKISLASKGKAKVRTHVREFPVIPSMIGLTVSVHNGKEFIPVEIKPEMLGHVLGEFSLTRKRLLHGKAGIGATRSSTAIAARK